MTRTVLGVMMGLVACVTGACNTVHGLREDIREVRERPSGQADDQAGVIAFKGEPDMRVRVAAGVDVRKISGPDRLVVRPVAGGKAAPVTVRGPVTVSSSDKGVAVAHPEGRAVFPFGEDVEIAPATTDGQASAVSLQVESTRYPGFVTIRPRWSVNPVSFDVVVSMPVETYLPGVLTHELWSTWPRQTFEAQAIAARTYALHERGRSRTEGRAYDVEDSTNDQVYGGSTTAIVPLEATRATRGLVITNKGRLLRAYYSSTCGGRPSSAGAVWRTDAGYEFNLAEPLQGQSRQAYCQASKHYRWEVTRTDDDVNRRLRSWGKANSHVVRDLTRLRRVEVEKTNAAGRPDRYALIDEGGRTYSLSAEELRNAFNASANGVGPLTMENTVKSGDLEVEVWANQVKVRGRGWGHGVGMCQWCAKGMADAGLDWATMLRAFYPGAEVVKAY
ncbi:MAG: cell division protein [Phycisphaerae bacterium]|nr:MAG: cell division protein [Phycisphaerae bacterium]